MVNGTQMTLEEWMPEACQQQIVGVLAHHAKISLLQKGRKGGDGRVREVFRILREIEEKNRPEWIIYENVKGMLSSNKGFDFLEILLAMDELSLNGRFSTVRIGECLKTGSAYTLSDILDDTVDEKYFLSREQMEKIVYSS